MGRQKAYTEQQLMLAAYELLRAKGPTSFTLRPLALRLGVSQPGLLKRIGSKHALLVKLQEWATERLRELVIELRASEPIEGLRSLFRSYARQARSPKELAHLLAFAALSVANPTLRAHLAERQELLVNAISDALHRAKRSRTRSDAELLVALLDGASLAWAIRQDGSLEQALQRSLQTVLDGTGAR